MQLTVVGIWNNRSCIMVEVVLELMRCMSDLERANGGALTAAKNQARARLQKVGVNLCRVEGSVNSGIKLSIH